MVVGAIVVDVVVGCVVDELVGSCVLEAGGLSANTTIQVKNTKTIGGKLYIIKRREEHDKKIRDSSSTHLQFSW